MTQKKFVRPKISRMCLLFVVRVLWMSTHGCSASPSPLLSSFWLLQPDGGSQEPDDATPTDYYYYPEGAYYYVDPTDDQE